MAYRLAAVVGGIGFTCGFFEKWRTGTKVACIHSGYGKTLLWAEEGDRTVWDSNWDCRDVVRKRNNEEKEDVSKPTASRHLILIRHGQYKLGEKEASKKVIHPTIHVQSTSKLMVKIN